MSKSSLTNFNKVSEFRSLVNKLLHELGVHSLVVSELRYGRGYSVEMLKYEASRCDKLPIEITNIIRSL